MISCRIAQVTNQELVLMLAQQDFIFIDEEPFVFHSNFHFLSKPPVSEAIGRTDVIFAFHVSTHKDELILQVHSLVTHEHGVVGPPKGSVQISVRRRSYDGAGGLAYVTTSTIFDGRSLWLATI
ncbi:hypothetical protein Tco_1018860 [Tanacetum coccineum]|uniref:Uncharacterized protein n=1 Tax=Tanacetum coccineum TaxID=301880 RepID=A0ABQ5FWZ9_9ASTR